MPVSGTRPSRSSTRPNGFNVMTLSADLRLKASILDTYASAFEHSHMEEARRLLGN